MARPYVHNSRFARAVRKGVIYTALLGGIVGTASITEMVRNANRSVNSLEYLQRHPNMFAGTNEEVKMRWLEFAKAARREFLIRKVERISTALSPSEIKSVCSRVSAEEKIPERVLRTIMAKESSFNPLATSGSYAVGLAQLMPITILDLAINRNFVVKNPFDPYQNLRGGAIVWKGYSRDAANHSKKWVKSRTYAPVSPKYWNGKSVVSFSDLPEETRLQIVAEMYNRGPDNVFRSGATKSVGGSEVWDVSLLLGPYSASWIKIYRNESAD